MSADVSRADQSSQRSRPPVQLWRFLVAGALVAVLDISFAETYWVVIRHATTYARVLQSIASGPARQVGLPGWQRHRHPRRHPPLYGCLWLDGDLPACVPATGAHSPGCSPSPYGAMKTGFPFGVVVWLVMDLVVCR